jgi:hypothetical protein
VYRPADVLDNETGAIVRRAPRDPGLLEAKATNRVADIPGATPLVRCAALC